MAYLARRVTSAGLRVAVRGSLGVADLRRLEQVCAPALEHRLVPLELEIKDLREIDEPARHFVVSLLRRGASLVGDRDGRWTAIFTA